MLEISTQTVAPPLATDARVPLAISSRVRIVGSVQFDGAIQIDGIVQGEIRCKTVTISERGAVEGLIIAENVTVAGEVNGSIYANKLVLKSACDVEGEIFHRELSLEDGSYFEGKSRPHATPMDLGATRDYREV